MKVCLHVGPPKTGTTSIQHALRTLYGSAEPQRHWFPLVPEILDHTGAHNRLAWYFLRKYYDPERGLALLQRIVGEARERGGETVLISGEDFAYAAAEDLTAIRRCCGDAEVRLLMTGNPLLRRVAAYWSQSLVSGSSAALAEFAPTVPDRPGYRRGFATRCVDAMQPCSATLVMSSPDGEPRDLLVSFHAACGLPAEDVDRIDVRRINRSLDSHQCAMLLRFNEVVAAAGLRQYPVGLRQALVRLLHSDTWTGFMPRKAVAAPAESVEVLRALAGEVREEIESLVHSGRLRVIGELETMFAGLPDGTVPSRAAAPDPTCEAAVPALAPRMTGDEIRYLSDSLAGASTYLEFGCGGSTRLAAEAGVSRAVSVETDRAWIERCRAHPAVRAAEAEGRLLLMHVDVGPLGPYGHPRGRDTAAKWPRYYLSPWSRFGGAAPRLVLIDGRWRIACMVQALLRCPPDARILAHDFDRPHYQAILRHAEVAEQVGTLASLRLRPDADKGALAVLGFEHLLDPR